MAQTNIKKYSIQQKLNKMDVDLIDVTVSADVDNAGSSAAGDLLFKVTEIPYAVAIPGGRSILQSCTMVVDDAETGAIDFIITSDSTALIGDSSAGDTSATETGDTAAGITSALSVMDGTCGFFTISNGFDAGVVTLGNKNNIGMVCKAASDSTSLYVWGIQQSAADYAESSIVLRFGFVKD